MPERCPFIYADSMIIVLDEDDESSAVERDYFNCMLEDENFPASNGQWCCPFPARWCRFKEQCTEFETMVMMASGRFDNECRG